MVRFGILQTFDIIETLGVYNCTWPPDPRASLRTWIVQDIKWCFLFLTAILTWLPLVLRIYHFQGNDIVGLMTAMSELNAISEVFVNLILCRLKRKKLQSILTKIKNFMLSANESEEAVLRKYIDRYTGFGIIVVMTYVYDMIVFTCGPLFLRPIVPPIETWYPFAVDTTGRKFLIYVLQVGAIILAGLAPTVDLMNTMMFWYPAARLEMLSLELKGIKCKKDLKLCIAKHHEILQFVEEVQDTIGILILKSNLSVAFCAGCGAFPLVYDQPLPVIAQFVGMVMTGCEKLYFIAWPADDLYEISKSISFSAYSVDWIDNCQEISSDVRFLMLRGQKPVTINMGTFLPPLSREYFLNFLKTVSSYFMALRAVVDNNN